MSWFSGHSDQIYVDISKDVNASIVGTNGDTGKNEDGSTRNPNLKQKTLTSVGEYRGLTQAAAEALVSSLTKDDTTSKIYYSSRYSSGEVGWIAFAVKIGTTVTVNASRADESDGWTARVTTTEYSADAGEGWSETRPASSTRNLVSKKITFGTYPYSGGIAKTTITTFVYESYFCTIDDVDKELTSVYDKRTPLWQVIPTTRHVPQKYADTVVNAAANATPVLKATAAPDSGTPEDAVPDVTDTVFAPLVYLNGNSSSVSASYVDEVYGWTITITEVEETGFTNI